MDEMFKMNLTTAELVFFFFIQMYSFIVSWINKDRITGDTRHLQASRYNFCTR